MENITRLVVASRISHLRAVVAKLVKRGAPLTLSINPTQVFKKMTDSDGSYMEAFNEASLSGLDIAVTGWTPAAKVEVLPSGTPLVQAFTNSDAAHTMMRNHTSLVCEHCNKKRSRKSFVLLVNAQNESKLVGTSCLEAFVGKGGAEMILMLANLLPAFVEASDTESCGGKVASSLSPSLLFALTSKLMERGGYVSKTKAEQIAIETGSLFMDTATEIKIEMRNLSKHLTDEYVAASNSVFQSAMSRLLESNTNGPFNSFQHNMFILNNEVAVESNKFGIAAYLAEWYRIQLERDAIKAAEAARKADASDCVSGKGTFSGKIISFKESFNEYGCVLKCLVEENRGFRLYGTVPKAVIDAVVGDVIQFNATVTVSDKDSKFGFFSRPTQAVFVKEVA